MEKVKFLKERGYEVLSVYTHELESLRKKDTLLNTIYNEHGKRKMSPLSIQDALVGGRVGYMRTYYNCPPDEEISMYDICSLVRKSSPLFCYEFFQKF